MREGVARREEVDATKPVTWRWAAEMSSLQIFGGVLVAVVVTVVVVVLGSAVNWFTEGDCQPCVQRRIRVKKRSGISEGLSFALRTVADAVTVTVTAFVMVATVVVFGEGVACLTSALLA